MASTIVTRGGQITLTKDVRERLGIKEGDTANINILGDLALVSKKDSSVFEKDNFLPETFEKTLHKMRRTNQTQRLKRLNIIS